MKKSGSFFFQIRRMDDMLAARIDAGDESIKNLIREIILSDNNTAMLTTDVMRGILKSSNTELHKLLADFLVAARLQEGVRQAVCESADCGTVEGFLTIFDTICEHNLIRYSAVKRAVATWTGIGGYEDIDRISAKVLEDIREGVDDEKKAYEFTQSNDSIRITIGLWSLGFRDVQKAIAVMKEYLKTGTPNQILTMSYYNRQLEYGSFCQQVAKEVIRRNAIDSLQLEYVAAFLPSYLKNIDGLISNCYRYKRDNKGKQQLFYYPASITAHYKDAVEAAEQFECLKKIYEELPKKKLEFSPRIFPWYGVSISKGDIVKRLCYIAYMLQDARKMEYAVKQIENIDSGYPGRGAYVRLLLHDAKIGNRRDILVELIGEKETSSRKTAFELLQEEMEPLTPAQYKVLEGHLRFKNSDIRKYTLLLLGKRDKAGWKESVHRLLASEKEEIREGGLSLVLEAKKKETLEPDILEAVQRIEAPSEKEKVMIEELVGESTSEVVLEAEGYGLYNPHIKADFEKEVCDEAFLKNYFSVSMEKIEGIIEKLHDLIDANKELEYRSAFGETKLLGNSFYSVTNDRKLPLEDQYPFKELWVEFYEKEINDPDLLNLLVIATESIAADRPEEMLSAERKILGSLVDYNCKYRSGKLRYACGSNYYATRIFRILQSIYGKGQIRKAGQEVVRYLLYVLPEKDRWHTISHPALAYRRAYTEKMSLSKDWQIRGLIREASSFETPKGFREQFGLLYQMDEVFRFNDVEKNQEHPYSSYSSRAENANLLGILDYVKACELGIISEELLYKAMFDICGLEYSLQQMGLLYQEPMKPFAKNCLKAYITKEELEQEKVDKTSAFYGVCNRAYQRAVDCILDVELKRGELSTVFSKSVIKIERFFGMNRMVQILVALGKDKLNRSRYYGWRQGEVSRQESFSHLLKACYPLPEDNAERLGELLKNKQITEQRLIEVAMYAPQWMDILEEYLGYHGFKLGCYYFMAHMNEFFDDRKKAAIARYTPLTVEELNQGAFDVNWFEEAYEKLGESSFDKLYDAAKYISDGSKHARARKYADAALGRVTEEQLEEEISDKRNKDLLMSYGLLPISKEMRKTQLVHRYEFIKKFQKESKKFGAQRRASESAASEMALRNLSIKAGFEDITRLTLAMETEIVKNYGAYFEWQQVDDVQVKLVVDEFGQTELSCEKNGKTLKSVPASLKKNETIQAVKEVHKKLKDQYSRTVKMFENAMETSESFYMEELVNLCENPVAAAIVTVLVFVTEDGKFGFIDKEKKDFCLLTEAGEAQELTGESKVRVAHAFDLYKAGVWHVYQEYFFKKTEAGEGRKQPFKQVFRELYVKLKEEEEQFNSRMFAGNQIQPGKTVACLKGRKWVADYEEGLQKIYYKQDIVARIYALADWFSPSDVEAPTLEWVEFSDRKTFKPIAIKDVPDIIYSEVMRDVDLAVSVAHAGGVDPETSHSTIEMRKVIVGFNLPLFGIKNVELNGTHALVEGKLGRYSIHLGSGVIHKMGGHQINVLPVHSQGRGRIFLPFVDEDPKTAEIMSKIILFAKDEKIKDPYILEQLR